MRRFISSVLTVSVLILAAVIDAGAQTVVPKDRIPSDAPAPVKALIQDLYSDYPPFVAKTASSLGGMGKDAVPSIPFLIGVLYDDRPLKIVTEYGPVPICSPALQVPCPIRGRPTTAGLEAAKALSRMGEPVLQSLLEAFRTGLPNRYDRKDSYVQQNAAYALGLLRDKRAASELLRAFNDPSYSKIRETVALALGDLGDATAVESLIAVIKDDALRTSAAEALGKLRDRRAMEPLLEILRTSGIHSRWVVAEAVVKMGKPRPMDRLIPLLNSSDSSIEEAATLAIGQIGVEDKDQSVIPLLAPKLSSRDTTGTYAVTYLGKLANQFWELDEIKDQAAVDALISAVGTHDTAAALVAAEILGDARIQRAIPAIANAVIYGGIDYPTYSAGGYSETGTSALKKINTTAAIEFMIGLALEKKCGTAPGCDGVFSALRKITNQDLSGADALAWQRWWNRNKPKPARRTTRR